MDVKVKNYLPIFFLALGVGLIIGGIFSISENAFLTIGLIPTGLIFVTTQYRLEINQDQKYYKEYIWLLGLKLGEKIKFDQIQYFYVTQSKRSQVYGQTYKNHYITGQHFNGYVKFSESEKISIGDSSSKDWLLKKISKMNSNLCITVKDYT